MGNAVTTAIGDNLTCFREHENQDAVGRGAATGSGKDLDDAVLAATSNAIGEHALSQTLRLTFGCKKLPNLDTFTRTDGMAILYEKKGNMWQCHGQTEVIMDNLDPEWVKAFDVPYKFEEQQIFKVVVYDIDDFKNLQNFDAHDKVGELQFTLHEVVTTKDQIMAKNICATKKDAMIEITGEEINGADISNEQVIVIPRVSFSDGKNRGEMLFFLMYRMHSGQGGRNNVWKPVYKSELKSNDNSVRGSSDFIWNQFSVMVQDICGGDDDREVKVEVFRSSKNGRHTNLGQILFTVNELKQNEHEVFKLTKSSGALTFDKLSVQKRNSFLEYIFGGCELNLAIAIDFTLSNGDPKNPDSLHTNNLKNNQYYQALKSVGDILQYYDTDKQFPLFGFGAKLQHAQSASHCFALNGNIFDPECDGIDGVLNAYKKALKHTSLYGPTHFNQILNLTNDMCEGLEISQNNQKYMILMIITDGIINDMDRTIDEIVRGSTLPLSIIIVGVGEADFSSMDILDADDEPLYSKKYKKHMGADIVQFVPFSEFKNDPRMLAKQTLEEVPGQFLGFMEKNNIVPKQVLEAQKREIKRGLTTQKSFKSAAEDKEAPEFFKDMEEKFINQCIQMGYDYTECKDFLEDKGLPVLSMDYFTANIQNPRYANPLFTKPAEENKQGNFGYYDPSNHMSAAPKGQPIQVNQGMGTQQQMMMDQDKNRCKVCLASDIQVVNIPCGHRCLCLDCSSHLKTQHCPICRKAVQQFVRTFDS